MTNTDIRTLRIFEFNRALSYVSEMIEIKRKLQKLQEEARTINVEYSDWQMEEFKTKKDKEEVQQIVRNLEKRRKEIIDEQKSLQKYLDELEDLVSKIFEFVFEKEELRLSKEEIQATFLEEYVYLLSEKIDGEYKAISEIFEDKADLAFLIIENYGMERKKLLVDIIDTEYEDSLPNNFENYFPLS